MDKVLKIMTIDEITEDNNEESNNHNLNFYPQNAMSISTASNNFTKVCLRSKTNCYVAMPKMKQETILII